MWKYSKQTSSNRSPGRGQWMTAKETKKMWQKGKENERIWALKEEKSSGMATGSSLHFTSSLEVKGV